MKSTINGMFSGAKGNEMGDGSSPNMAGCELRPGGMLVQKRDDSNVNQNSAPVSTVRVKVKYGSSYHEIRISSHASFGELKKMLAEPTGLHPQDQKLFFKKKERDSKSYLDIARVKNSSKLVLMEDIDSRERRRLESLKTTKMENTSKSLKEINLEVDKLVKQVAALKTSTSAGEIVAEMDVENLTENLMRKLIQLDEIVAEGDLKLQRREQVRSVQKHIEILDSLKMAKPNSTVHRNEDNKMSWERQSRSGVQKSAAIQREQVEGNITPQQMPKQQQPLKHSESVVVTTNWETFD